jgi:hypothetical protein
MEVTLIQMMLFGRNPGVAASQIQKAFDWEIGILSSLANALATALLGILATSAVEYYKDSLRKPHISFLLATATVFTVVVYVALQRKIARLRDGYVDLSALILGMEE